VTGVAYNPLAKTFRLVADPAVNYMMAFRRPDA
jgi:2-polyprenyl-3-methyl-5-hydroxy-6-metoxy-1,4-benzoquinol methylase